MTLWYDWKRSKAKSQNPPFDRKSIDTRATLKIELQNRVRVKAPHYYSVLNLKYIVGTLHSDLKRFYNIQWDELKLLVTILLRIITSQCMFLAHCVYCIPPATTVLWAILLRIITSQYIFLAHCVHTSRHNSTLGSSNIIKEVYAKVCHKRKQRSGKSLGC